MVSKRKVPIGDMLKTAAKGKAAPVLGSIVVVGLLFVCYLGAGLLVPGDIAVEAGAATEAAAADEGDDQSTEPATIYVHIAGAVNQPGLYELEEGTRVGVAIEAAGGFSADADTVSVNLARVLSDGDQVVVPVAGETGSPSSAGTSGAASSTANGGKVNINTATSEQLQTLDGIGSSTAEKIIAYREQNGLFSTIEEIKNVSGIGDKKYEAIKDAICV